MKVGSGQWAVKRSKLPTTHCPLFLRMNMQTLWQDLRFGFRTLTRKPGFTIVAIIALALGIGANTAIFSVVNSVLLRPLAYREPERLVVINHDYPKLSLKATVSAIGYTHYRDNAKSFESVVAMTGGGFNLTGGGDPEQVNGSRITHNFFSALGAEARLGRVFLPEEDQPGKNTRPSLAAAPSALKKLCVIREPFTCSGSPPPVRLKPPPVIATTLSNDLALSR